MSRKRRPIRVKLHVVHRYEISEEIHALADRFISVLESMNTNSDSVEELVNRKAESIVDSFAEMVKQ